MKVAPAAATARANAGVLREEAVSGVHRVGTAAGEGLKDRFGREVALGRGLSAEGVGLIGEPDMKRVVVDLRVDGDGANRLARGRSG